MKSINISDYTISNIQIVDDDPQSRNAFSFIIEDLELTPLCIDGPLPRFDDFIMNTVRSSQASIFDNALNVRNYSRSSGAKYASALYKRNYPSILCSKFAKTMYIDKIQEHRRYLPVLLKSQELNSDTFHKGLEKCINEFKNNFTENRKPYKSLIRIENIDKNNSTLHGIIPGWNPNEIIAINFSNVPKSMISNIKNETRCYVKTNIGAEKWDELYFTEWELIK